MNPKHITPILFLLFIFAFSSCKQRYKDEAALIANVEIDPESYEANRELGMFYYMLLMENIETQDEALFKQELDKVNPSEFPREIKATSGFTGLEHESAHLIMNAIYYFEKTLSINPDTDISKKLERCYGLLD